MNARDTLSRLESAMRDWVAQLDEPAALLQPSPWCLVPNPALQALLADAPSDAASLQQAWGADGGGLAAQLARGQPFSGRLRWASALGSGANVLLQADFAPLEGSEGLWLCTCIDLSAIQRSATRRATTLQHLQHTLNQVHDLISLLDSTETLLFVNDTYANFHGTPAEKCVGKTVLEIMGANNHAWTAPYRARLFSSLQPVRYQGFVFDKQKDERVLDIFLWPIIGAQGRLAKMATLGRDVTLRHHGMEALRQTLERLDALFEAGIEGILLCEAGRIVDANPIACRLLGQEREQLIGHDALQALQRLGLPEGEDSAQQLSLTLLPDAIGRKPPLQIQSIHFVDEDQPCHAVLLQDMSYRYKAQKRIDRLVTDLRWQTARAEAADRGKSVFLASASHDLRQPIHALGLFLTTIQSLGAAPPPLRGEPLAPVAQRMRASLDGLMELLNLLLGASLSASHSQQLPLRPMPLQPLLDDVYRDFAALAAEKGLQLHVLPSRAWTLSDPAVLRRILNNLASNALRYTRQGRVVIGVRPRGAQVELQVWDTGIGIAPDQLEAIFREFYRVDLRPAQGERSEGLGLSIVRRAAAELGARLDLRSLPGRGSMFSVLLPRCAALREHVPSAAAAALAPPMAAPQGKHVLLIDDDEMVLIATTRLLEAWGHQVHSAPSAIEAMRLCEADSPRIDTVICDYMLDPSMDGLELLLRLRERRSGPLSVCMVTGDISAERIAQARLHGFTLLHKPVNAQELQRFLAEGA